MALQKRQRNATEKSDGFQIRPEIEGVKNCLSVSEL